MKDVKKDILKNIYKYKKYGANDEMWMYAHPSYKLTTLKKNMGRMTRFELATLRTTT